MTRRRSTGFAIAAAAALLAGLTACAPDATAPADLPGATGTATAGPDESALAAAFEAALAERGVVGGMLVVDRGDAGRASVPVGTADLERGEAVTESTLFGYQSITKSFVATAVLALADSGRLSLDDPIGDYVDALGDGGAATIRDLLAMRSGLRNYSAIEPVQSLIAADLERQWSVDELLAGVRQDPLDAPPGTRFEYSNTNTVLLGNVLERVTGMPWADAVGELVLSPAGLDSVVFPGNEARPADAAAPYEVLGSDATPEALPFARMSLFDAAGGLMGTAGDLATWARALGEGTLVTAATQQERLASCAPTTDDPVAPHYDAYGLGIGELRGWVGHTGTGIGYQSLAMFNPATGAAVAIVVNTIGDDPDAPATVFEAMLDDPSNPLG